ncbi:efflux transporter outer membrane subunit [Comamonas guangdongensis]|uniref:Efflux transporter outer membrane subunit n=1 Tax=Comamonas guangdongensis TaxID=510515 RepID=A0ABV3ZXY6_9BURK
MFELHGPTPAPRFGLVTGALALALALILAACSALGPDFTRPAASGPDTWSGWHAADESLLMPVDATRALSAQWWQAFNDPVLNRLEQRALDASPDLQSAALRFAQARVQRSVVSAQRGPEIDAGAGIDRQRQSEYGAATRMLDLIGGNRAALAQALSRPFTLYQAGFDASWEPDLWGRVSRSIEAADADVDAQAALLDLARLALASDMARNYFELRTTQRQLGLAREDAAALRERTEIVRERVKAGVVEHGDLDRQQAELAALDAQLPGLLAQEGMGINQIALLLGEPPASLRRELSAPIEAGPAALPDFALGLPSEVARRRPDILVAEARLHRATANIGVARAELHPSIRLGAHFGYESYLGQEFGDWRSRTWSVGPSLSLPLFDRGRRKTVIVLRELEQQEAAVNYQRTVLGAWQEIDDALTAYAAELQRSEHLKDRVQRAADVYALSRARYTAGATDFIAVLDGQRSLLQARRDLVASEGRLSAQYVAINKAIGNVR